MPDHVQTTLAIAPAGPSGGQPTPGSSSPPSFCSNPYALNGPQVEPVASYFLKCLNLRMVTEAELTGAVPTPQPYPTDETGLKNELEELIQLARLRDEPGQIEHRPTGANDPQGQRLPLSLFLQLRPQPLGAVVNTARGQNFPVINSGRELARYFENETPGLAHQLALDYILRNAPLSPPRQAAIWAALNVTIASALGAAWYFKWRGPAGVRYRLRPWECRHSLDVLFDRVSNSTNSADGPRRGFPVGVQPMASPHPGTELLTPEGQVPDIKPILGDPGSPPLPANGYPSPGTPRHPAYPSGHSTYSAAASRLLGALFPEYAEEFKRLADNIGMARLWAGVHWRTDHTFGQTVGHAVADLVLNQLLATPFFDPPSGAPVLPTPPPAISPFPPGPLPPPNQPVPPQGGIPDPCAATGAGSGA